MSLGRFAQQGWAHRPKQSLVRFLGASNEPIGTGCVTVNGLIVTCAHVVEAALKLTRKDAICDLPRGRIALDFPFLDNESINPRPGKGVEQIYYAEVAPSGWGWTKDSHHSNDIAILQLIGLAPSLYGCKYAENEAIERNLPVWIQGFPTNDAAAGKVDAVLQAHGELTDGILTLDFKDSLYILTPGYSGAPVFQANGHTAIGMFIGRPHHLKESHRDTNRIAYAIPAKRIVAMLDIATAALDVSPEPKDISEQRQTSGLIQLRSSLSDNILQKECRSKARLKKAIRIIYSSIHDTISSVIRTCRSFLEMFIFCLFRLDVWSGVVFIIGFIGFVFFALIGIDAYVVAFAFLMIWGVILLKFLKAPSMLYPRNADVFGIVLTAFPTQDERKLNFETLPRPKRLIGATESIEVVRDGPIVISERFNVEAVMNPHWNPALVVDSTRQFYLSTLRYMRQHSDVYSKVLKHKIFEALSSKLPLINEGKVGICSNITSDNRRIIVYKTDYFCGILTSNFTAQDIQEVRSNFIYDLSYAIDRIPFHKRRKHYDLAAFDDPSKHCSHHLGIDVLAITRDFYLPLMIQAQHTQVSQGLLAPTGSGSVDWKDQKRCGTLKDLLAVAAERELREEATRQRGDPNAWIIESMVPIGYFRMPHRAGKPQFVYLAKLANDSTEIGPNREVAHLAGLSRESTFFRVRTLEDLNERVLDLIKNGHPQYAFSVPLWGSLVCLHHAISRNRRYVSEASGY